MQQNRTVVIDSSKQKGANSNSCAIPTRRSLCASGTRRGVPRDAAKLPELRFHDLRHTAITELAEMRVPDSVLKSIARHITHQMLDHYSHIRSTANRQALDRLDAYRASIPPTHFRINNFRNIDARSRIPVTDALHQGFTGVCDTVLTQYQLALT
jgi:hypothetical protein